MSSALPTVAKFALLNGLITPPAAIFNEPTFALLLKEESTSEGPHVLQTVVQEYRLSLAEILEKILPTFSSTGPVFANRSQQ
jgi:hypothetical protein